MARDITQRGDFVVARFLSSLGLILLVGFSAAAQQTTQVLVIGGGIGGLAALDQLKQAGISDVLLVEATHRVGGRMWTQRGEGPLYERGAELVNTTDTSLKKLLKKYKVSLTERRFKKLKNEETFIFKERLSGPDAVTEGNYKVFTFHELISAAHKVPGDVQSFEKYYQLQINRSKPGQVGKDAQAFLQNNTADKLVEGSHFFKAFLNALVVSEFGVPMNKISAEVIADYIEVLPVKGNKNKYEVTIFPGADERYRIKGGTDSLVLKIYEKHQDQILLNSKATEIEQLSEEKFVTTVKDHQGEVKKITSEFVVVAVPSHQFPALSIRSPEISLKELEEVAGMPFCTNAKIFLKFSKKFWYEGQTKSKFSGVAVLESGVQVWDTSEDQANDLGGVITLYPGDWPDNKKQQEDRLKIIFSELKNIPVFKDLEKYLVGADQQVWKQSYAGAFNPDFPRPPALFTKNLKSQIYFVGSDKDVTLQGQITATFGYMEGAVRTAEKAVSKILKQIKISKKRAA